MCSHSYKHILIRINTRLLMQYHLWKPYIINKIACSYNFKEYKICNITENEVTWRGNLGILIPFDLLIFSVWVCAVGNLELAPIENSNFEYHHAIFIIL